jgi:hypothetical protein
MSERTAADWASRAVAIWKARDRLDARIPADWRREPIGLGVTRCPGDNDNFDASIERDLIDAYERKFIADTYQPTPNGTAIFAEPLTDAEIQDIKRRWLEMHSTGNQRLREIGEALADGLPQWYEADPPDGFALSERAPKSVRPIPPLSNPDGRPFGEYPVPSPLPWIISFAVFGLVLIVLAFCGVIH